MKYFRLWLRGDTDDKSLAFVRETPTGLGLYDYCMRRGERIGDHYPPNEKINIKVNLDKRSPGIKLASLLGNTLSYLMLNTQAKDVFLSICKCEIEVLPFVLYNHKKRIHSNDYSILNPIGTFDCVNRGASNITYSAKQEVIAVGMTPGSIVFDSKKMGKAPDIFRVPEEPALLFISTPLAKAIKQHALTNVLLIEEMKMQ